MTKQAAAKALFLKENLRAGELYGGLILGKDGEPDHHVFLLPGEAPRAPWKKQMEWAKSLGGELPTRREQALLFANLKERFQPAWYWSGEQLASLPDSAWMQYFGHGAQYNNRKSNEGRACAIRRLKIL